MITRCYAPPEAFVNGRVNLSAAESRHLGRTLRRKVGDHVDVVDGVGGCHTVRLDRMTKEGAIGTVLDVHQEVGEPLYHLTMAVALLKNPNRFETFLEKAVELGVGRIVPMVTTRTEKHTLRPQRAQNILIAALKQCGRSRLPELTAPQSFTDVVQQANGQKIICHEQAPMDQTLQKALASPLDDVHILIGPEGGFTDVEIAQAEAAAYTIVALGPHRLRTETAALLAAGGVLLASL